MGKNPKKKEDKKKNKEKGKRKKVLTVKVHSSKNYPFGGVMKQN